MSWPDYCTRETLAKRLELKPGAIDQLVTRGILPVPQMIGDAMRWRWATVEAALSGGRHGMDSARAGDDAGEDPFIAGARRAAEAAATRPRRNQAA